jgi:cell division transport system permease protein
LSGILTPGDIRMVIFIAAIVFVLGFLISLVSTWLALNKFLRLKFDELFY